MNFLVSSSDLKPYEADNFDLSFEYYEDDFVFTLGMFHKDIENTIYPRVLANQTIGVYSFTNRNLCKCGESSITGFELNIFSELDKYLPIDGFFIAFNTTRSDGESEFDTGIDTHNSVRNFRRKCKFSLDVIKINLILIR